MSRLAGFILAFALTLGGCVAGGGTGRPQTPNPPMTLSVSNGTTIAVSLVVNGSVVETVPPGGHEDPIKAKLPALPWNVQMRSPSGRVLSTLSVHAGDVWQTALPNGGLQMKGDAVRVDLSCGRLDVWSGPPLLGPTFIPGPSGDCA
jgi:hypothetical protein